MSVMERTVQWDLGDTPQPLPPKTGHFVPISMPRSPPLQNKQFRLDEASIPIRLGQSMAFSVLPAFTVFTENLTSEIQHTLMFTQVSCLVSMIGIHQAENPWDLWASGVQ